MINIFQPSLGEQELKALDDVFKSNWLGRGKSVTEFEKRFADMLSTSPSRFHAISSCTEGLFLASELYNWGSGDDIIAPSISFIAVGSAIVACGAKLVLCDVDPRSLNVTAELIEEKLTDNTKAVIITHYGGHPCDMDPIMALAEKHDLKIIEDSACAPGSLYKGDACGTIGDMGVWSFDAMKTITTGDGGMLYIKSDDVMNVAKEQLYLGLAASDKSGLDRTKADKTNWWEVQINRPGRRAIMNNMMGALGCIQMEKIQQYLARRREIYERYNSEFKDIDWLQTPPELLPECTNSYYFYWIQTEYRDALARFMLENGVYTTFRYWPLHKVEYFQMQDLDLPGSELATATTLNIPLHQDLSDEDVKKVVGTLKAFGETL